MARYQDRIRIIKTKEGKRFYSTVLLEDVVAEEQTYEYTTRLGDRWDTIAYKYLGSASLWYVVARANGGANGSIFIEPGTVIKIPGR